jgi:hypothetical protein
MTALNDRQVQIVGQTDAVNLLTNAMCNLEAENPGFSFSFGCFARFPPQKPGFWESLHMALTIANQAQNTDREGRLNITVALPSDRRVRTVVTTPLGNQQVYELLVSQPNLSTT